MEKWFEDDVIVSTLWKLLIFDISIKGNIIISVIRKKEIREADVIIRHQANRLPNKEISSNVLPPQRGYISRNRFPLRVALVRFVARQFFRRIFCEDRKPSQKASRNSNPTMRNLKKKQEERERERGREREGKGNGKGKGKGKGNVRNKNNRKKRGKFLLSFPGKFFDENSSMTLFFEKIFFDFFFSCSCWTAVLSKKRLHPISL